jgi:hypothetical protein
MVTKEKVLNRINAIDNKSLVQKLNPKTKFKQLYI